MPFLIAIMNNIIARIICTIGKKLINENAFDFIVMINEKTYVNEYILTMIPNINSAIFIGIGLIARCELNKSKIYFSVPRRKGNESSRGIAKMINRSMIMKMLLLKLFRKMYATIVKKITITEKVNQFIPINIFNKKAKTINKESKNISRVILIFKIHLKKIFYYLLCLMSSCLCQVLLIYIFQIFI